LKNGTYTLSFFFRHHSRCGKKQHRFFPVTKDPSTIPEDTPRKRKTRHSQNPPVESHVGWIMDSRAHLKEDTGSEVGSLGSRFGFDLFKYF
jgi:hypothetical protein